MAVVGPTLIQDVTKGDAVRLSGSLAAGTTLTNGNSYRARLLIVGKVSTIDVRCKATVSAGTPTIQIVPQTPDIHPPDLTVSSVVAGLATATGLVTAVEGLASVTYRGEQVVDIVIDATVGAAAGTLTYVDVLTT